MFLIASPRPPPEPDWVASGSGLPASQQGRAAAGMRPVVQLPDVVRCTRLQRCASCLRGGRARRRRIARAAVAADSSCHIGLPSGQRGRAAAGVLPVVQLPDVVRCTRLGGVVLGAHQPAEERHAAQGPLPAFGRSRDPEQDVAAQLRRWLELAGLAVHPSSEKGNGGGQSSHAAASRALGRRLAIGVAGRSCKRGRFFALPRHLGASRRHLDRNRGPRGRGEFVSAERPRRRASGAGVHVDGISRSLPRDVRGLWPVTGGRVNLAVTFFRFFSPRKLVVVCWLVLRPLGLGWDGEVVVRR
jgi:hypothetical protein